MAVGERPARIARVVIDSPLPHLDGFFDYAIPERLERVTAGFRVRVPFAGRLVSAVVMEVAGESSFEGRLSEVRTAAHAPSFTHESLRLAGEIARRYGGSTWDVLRLMAPPRVAAVEKRTIVGAVDDRERWGTLAAALSGEEPQDAPRLGANAGSAVTHGAPARIVRQCVPDPGAPGSIPAREIVREAASRLAVSTGSVIVVVPDARATAALVAALREAGAERWIARGGGDFVVLDADDGPSVRYGQYLTALRGEARLVIGTRATAMQPVPSLAALVLWDDGHSAYEDPHAPYPHARTVAAMRSEAEHADLTLASYAPSVDAAALVEHGWARLEEPTMDEVRERTATITVWDDARREAEGPAGFHWMPPGAWRRLMSARERGPVAIVVPRAGYVAAAACARCDEWARCRECEGPVAIARAGEDPQCTVCGVIQSHWHCPHCQGSRLAHRRQGVLRIAEQLRAMAPGVSLVVSAGATEVLSDGAVSTGIVVATPGALPAVPGGYAHVVVVDASVPSTGLGGEIAALRLWIAAAAVFVSSRKSGGEVTVVGSLPDLTSRALGTWRTASAALEAYRERFELSLPPATRHVRVEGDLGAAKSELREAERDGAIVVRDAEGASLLVSRAAAQGCVDALRAAVRRASKQGGGPVRLRVDGPLRLR
ncbi:hypothetical protein [Demequina sp. NBRC 110052]|uniref:primosomal protein N' family DNA-binding protein n=1 Tax=Demequina sp. NBRC 110052 TaxID=1570341 RepID=UPI000A048C68|nr:hypothetical protein [Demequina sp. NBRC 110052]